jgi:hypothetical protein
MIGISKCRSVAHFARLGIQIHGFLRMQLPREMRFMDLIHAADERIPVDALRFGTDAVFQVPQRYGRSQVPARACRRGPHTLRLRYRSRNERRHRPPSANARCGGI